MKPLVPTICLLFTLGLISSIAWAGTVTDIDGNVYQTVIIGKQEWMAENLKVTHYRNGVAIPNDTDGGVWAALTTGSYSEYNNDSSNVATYGRLYNWFAVVDTQNLAPAGWHVPTNAEWQTLVDSLGGYTVAGGKLKETGTAHWASPNAGATNQSGFSALPSGYRSYAGNGAYYYLTAQAYFWTSTRSTTESSQAWYLTSTDSLINGPSANMNFGFAVRCVKDVSCCHGTRGNVNGVGIVDAADLAALVNYLVGGGYVLPCPDAANINGTGIIDAADLAALVNYLVAGGYVLPSCP